jgi:hypothetical protein
MGLPSLPTGGPGPKTIAGAAIVSAVVCTGLVTFFRSYETGTFTTPWGSRPFAG